MVKCATRHPADWREGRRLRAWELKQQGWSQRRIAEALGVTHRSGHLHHNVATTSEKARQVIHRSGVNVWEVARTAKAPTPMGVTPGAVSQWMRRQRESGGIEALDRCPPPGPTPKLTAVQRAQLPALLARGAEAYGCTGNV
jgi:predicted transcriptional regulator